MRVRIALGAQQPGNQTRCRRPLIMVYAVSSILTLRTRGLVKRYHEGLIILNSGSNPDPPPFSPPKKGKEMNRDFIGAVLVGLAIFIVVAGTILGFFYQWD